MMDVAQPRILGDFANRLLYGSYEATVDSMLPTATMHQLPNAGLYVWGSFFDENGVIYTVCRDLLGYSTNGCLAMSNAAANGLRILPRANLWRGAVAVSRDGNTALWQSADVFQGMPPSFRLAFDNGAVEYEEQDFVSLTARRDLAGYQFYDPSSAQGSGSQVYPAGGKLAGKAVSGWLGLNTHFQAPGINYRISPMIKDKLLVTWFDLVNIYEDGSREQGVVMIGRGGYNFVMIVNNNGQVTQGSEVIADFTVRADGYPLEITIRYFDTLTGEPMTWIWRLRPNTEMVDLPKAAPYHANKRSAEGTCTRAGEQRPLRHGVGWLEFQADDRLAAYRAEVSSLCNIGKFR